MVADNVHEEGRAVIFADNRGSLAVTSATTPGMARIDTTGARNVAPISADRPTRAWREEVHLGRVASTITSTPAVSVPSALAITAATRGAVVELITELILTDASIKDRRETMFAPTFEPR